MFQTRYSGAGIATRSYVTLYNLHHQKSTVYAALSMGRQFRYFNIEVTLEVHL